MTEDIMRNACLIVTSNLCRCGNKWTASRIVGTNGLLELSHDELPEVILTDARHSNHIFCYRCVSLHLPRGWAELYASRHARTKRNTHSEITYPATPASAKVADLNARLFGEKKC